MDHICPTLATALGNQRQRRRIIGRVCGQQAHVPWAYSEREPSCGLTVRKRKGSGLSDRFRGIHAGHRQQAELLHLACRGVRVEAGQAGQAQAPLASSPVPGRHGMLQSVPRAGGPKGRFVASGQGPVLALGVRTCEQSSGGGRPVHKLVRVC